MVIQVVIQVVVQVVAEGAGAAVKAAVVVQVVAAEAAPAAAAAGVEPFAGKLVVTAIAGQPVGLFRFLTNQEITVSLM